MQAVTDKLGIPHAGEWLDEKSVKLKFLVEAETGEEEWPVTYRDFSVHHDYLPCQEGGPQARVRRRGRHGKWMYTHTVRKQEGGEVVETRTSVTRHLYQELLAQAA